MRWFLWLDELRNMLIGGTEEGHGSDSCWPGKVECQRAQSEGSNEK